MCTPGGRGRAANSSGAAAGAVRHGGAGRAGRRDLVRLVAAAAMWGRLLGCMLPPGSLSIWKMCQLRSAVIAGLLPSRHAALCAGSLTCPQKTRGLGRPLLGSHLQSLGLRIPPRTSGGYPILQRARLPAGSPLANGGNHQSCSSLLGRLAGLHGLAARGCSPQGHLRPSHHRYHQEGPCHRRGGALRHLGRLALRP